MTTAKDILEFVNSLAPEYMKEEWDNVGLLCGSETKEVKRILVALDPFTHVCHEAVGMEADLLITHHPIIFEPLKALTDSNPVGRSLLLLAGSGICAINAHTNLDLAPGGVNDVLAKTLGLSEISVIDPAGEDACGNPYGLLRCGTTQETDLASFLTLVKEKLGTPILRYANGGNSVSRVAVGSGACASELYAADAAGCDTFVTSDVKYNHFWDAKELGLNLIDAGHFYTENPVVPVLAAALQARFPEIEVKVSETHSDCMEFA